MHYRTAIIALLLAPSLAAQAPTESAVLRLRPGDAVRVQVGTRDWRPDLPRGEQESERPNDFAVLEEGVVLLPMIGVVRVADRPFSDVRTEIRDRYAEQLVDTPVLVTPVLRIPVLGEVQQPGLMPVDPTLTIADIVAAAGGLTPRGDPDRIMLVRAQGTTRVSLSVADGGGTLNLEPGDQIVVGRQGWFRENLNVLLPSTASIVAATITALILRP